MTFIHVMEARLQIIAFNRQKHVYLNIKTNFISINGHVLYYNKI